MTRAPLFRLGRVVATPAAMDVLATYNVHPTSLLHRHMSGDFGDLWCEDDRAANEDAIKTGNRILSNYQLGNDDLWVITEADRSVTTILLPSDY